LKFVTNPAVIALGLTNLYLLALSGPLISPAHDLVYHLIGASSSLFVPILIYMMALWALLTGLLLLARRTPAEPDPRRTLLRLLIWYSLLVTLPWSLLHTCAGFVSWDVPAWIDLLFSVAVIATLTLLLTRRPALLRALGTVEPVLSVVFSFFALSGVLVLSQMVWFAAQAHHLNPPTHLHHKQPTALGAAADPPHSRIVWILLDELSYQQIYERRYPGLDLPAFDQLAAQSTNFTHVVPAGEFTRNILPTLFTGIPTNRIRVDGRGMLLSLHDSVAHQWKPFAPHQTVFQDALDHGYSSGVAGWYNPYCRILPDVLDSCYWVYHEATPARLSPNRTAGRNLLRPLRLFRRRVLYLLYRLHLRGSAPPPPSSDDQLDIRMHASDYHDLLAAGDHLLDDPSIDFLFLHLPVPHPFGFYDRRTGTISTVHTSYLDNLALADRYLAHVHELLASRHEWDASTVVVMGDHSWRTSFIWVDAGSWTEEEDRASHHGEFDPRPGYLVKLPNQHQPARIDQPFDAVRTRALLDALLANTLKTPTDLAHWTATR